MSLDDNGGANGALRAAGPGLLLTRRASLIAAAAALVVGPAAAAEQRLAGETVRALRSICENAVRAKQTAGLAARVQRSGAVLFAGGFGAANLETNTPVDQQSVFRIGSTSKQFAAAGLLLLQEDGRLSLEDSLAKFLPGFPRAAEVTLRELLNHTSGIANISKGIVPWVDYSTSQLVDIISRQTPLYRFDPGTGWAYSNTGFDLAGAVIEHVVGKPYWRFYAERLFAKGGMTSTGVDFRADVVPGRASGYSRAVAAPSGFENAPYLSWTIPGAAGGLRSTPIDLARWQDALFNGRVLGAASLKQMTTPSRLKDGRLASAARSGPAEGTQPVQEYGLGLELSEVDGRRRAGHYGSILGFAADMGAFPDLGVTVVTLTNTDFSADNPPRALERVVLADPLFKARRAR